MAAASTSTTAGPGTASHVAGRRSATHMDSAAGEGAISSAKAAIAPQKSTTTRQSNTAIVNPLPITTTATPIRSPLPTSTPSSSSSKPPTTTPTPPTKKPSSSTPSAPVTVHPSPSSSLTIGPLSSPLNPPTLKHHKMRHRQVPTDPSTHNTDPPPPDPALFTFPSLLSTLGAEASTPLHAIAEICGRSKMSLADEHGAHMPPPGSMLLRQEQGDGKAVGQKKGDEEGDEEGTQRLDGRGRGVSSGAPMMGIGAEDREVIAVGVNGASGKGWMEGVMAWLWGGAGKGGGEQGTARDRRRAARDLRRGLEEREGEAGQG